MRKPAATDGCVSDDPSPLKKDERYAADARRTTEMQNEEHSRPIGGEDSVKPIDDQAQSQCENHNDLDGITQEEQEREQAYLRECIALIKKREKREESISLQADMTRAADERARKVGIGFAYYDVVQGRREQGTLPFVWNKKRRRRKSVMKRKEGSKT